jgi:hypothetical protein
MDECESARRQGCAGSQVLEQLPAVGIRKGRIEEDNRKRAAVPEEEAFCRHAVAFHSPFGYGYVLEEERKFFPVLLYAGHRIRATARGFQSEDARTREKIEE